MDEALARRLADIEARLRAIEAALPTATAAASAGLAEDLAAIKAEAIAVAGPAHPPAGPAPFVPTIPPRPHWDGEVDDRGFPIDSLAAQAVREWDTKYGRPATPRPTSSTTPPPLPKPPTPRPASASPAQTFERQFSPHDFVDPAGPALPREELLPPPPPPAEGMDFEHVVGLKWTGWVGAIVLVIGAALGIKFVYEQGYFRGVSDATRCELIAVGGLALLATGEFVYRRINRIASSGFYGAGVAVLYLAVYAAQSWYQLIDPGTAVGLLTGVAAAGMLVAARADLVSVAGVAVLGAAVCPLFTGALEHRPAGFRIYLLAIELMAMGLCAWRAAPKWWLLRGLTLLVVASDMVVGTQGEIVDGVVLNGVLFALLAGTIFQGELVFTTWRRPRGLPAEWVKGTSYSFLVTATVAAIMLVDTPYQSRWIRGELLLWLALAVTTTGLFVARRSVALTLLGRGFYVQAILLLMLAVPVALDGPERLFGWMALAVGLAVLAWANGDDLAAGGATVVWLLAGVMTNVWAFNDGGAEKTWLTLGGESVYAVTVVAFALMLAGHAVAVVLQRLFGLPARQPGDRIETSTALLIDCLAAATFAAALVAFQSPDFATRAGLAYGGLLWLATLVPAMFHLHPVALLVLSAVAVKWAAFDVLRSRLLPTYASAGRPFLNPQAATGLSIAAAFGVTGWVDRRRAYGLSQRRAPADTLWTTLASLMVAVLGFGLVSQLDLVLDQAASTGGFCGWPGRSAYGLWHTAIAAVCVVGWLILMRRTLYGPDRRRGAVNAARVMAYVLVAKFVLLDVLANAVGDATVTAEPVFNLQVAVATILLALLAFVALPRAEINTSGKSGLVALAMVLITGSAEIDRWAVQQTVGPAWILRQVGWSVYWGLVAVLTLGVGFASRSKRLRVAALVLMAATLLKIVLIDMAGAGTGWRILSFLGLGGVLLLTSVLYGRFKRLPHAASFVDRSAV